MEICQNEYAHGDSVMKRISAGRSKTDPSLSTKKDERKSSLRRGQQIAKPRPAEESFIGRLKGVIKVVGDVESPVVPPEAWASAR